MLKKTHIQLLRTLFEIFLKKGKSKTKSCVKCIDDAGIDTRLSDMDLEYVPRPGQCAIAQGHLELTIVDKILSRDAKTKAEEVRLLILNKLVTIDENVVVKVMTIQNRTEQSAYFVTFILSTDCLNKSQE